MWKNIVEPDRPQMTIRLMCFACWFPRATDTHSKYEILVVFPLQLCWHAGLYVTIYVHCVSCLLSVMA